MGMQPFGEAMSSQGYEHKVVNGYEYAQIISKNLNNKTSKSTSVKRTNFASASSIEGKVIEKKVIEKRKAFNADVWEALARSKYSNTKMLVVDNREYISVSGKDIELPKQVTSLIDNPMYLPRYKKLARLHGVKYLLKLAELAKMQNHYQPNRWFAKSCGVKNWQEKTFNMLNEVFRKIEHLKDQLRSVGIDVTNKWLPYYLKAKNKLSEGGFNQLLEMATARHVSSPECMLGKITKLKLAGELKPVKSQ